MSKAPLHDVVPVYENPAYQLVTIQRTDEQHINQSSAISGHSTTQQPIDSDAVPHQYENVVEVNKKTREDGNKHDYENMRVE